MSHSGIPPRFLKQRLSLPAWMLLKMVGALILLAEPAFSICLSPYQTLFACDIDGSKKRVEICAIHSEYLTSSIRYEFGKKWRKPELSFEAVGNYGSATFLDFGIGLLHPEGQVFAVYAQGSYEDGRIDHAVVKAFNSLDDFTAGTPTNFDAECRAGTIEGDFRFFAP
jgi:hypothetical protein